jgi:ubiquinone biosynthesis protein Coq4
VSKIERGYKDGLQPESLADGNWLVKQNQPVSKIERGYKDGLQPESLADGNWSVKQNQPVSRIETKVRVRVTQLYPPARAVEL